jgi:hypothetical protein
MAWCVLFAAAHITRAQYPAFDGPPPGMDPEREMEFSSPGGEFANDSILVSDGEDRPEDEYGPVEGGAVEGGPGYGPQFEGGPQGGGYYGEVSPNPNGDVEFGPEVSGRFGAAYDYTEEQGNPYIMQQYGGAARPGSFYDPNGPPPPPSTYCPCMTRLGFRHSYTHGRNVGWGEPLVGSSWLNRPYYWGATLGPMWLTNRPISTVPRDADVMGSLFFGWDWDYYWGSEFQYAYATPELHNTAAPPGSSIGHRLVSWNYSFMYYPWGDSNLRPYWRLGVGNSKFDYGTPDGFRRDEWLFTNPVGIGVKYSFRRWLAGRVEFTDQFSWGGHGTATQHNLLLSFGLECRFGGRRKSYWPWNPSSHIW